MSTEPETPKPTSGDRLATFAVRLIRVLVRVLLVLLIGAGLGVAAYFGGPALYRHYIEPVQVNTQRIADLEQSLARVEANAAQDREQWTARLADIEARQAAQAESLAALQADLASQQSGLEALTNLPDRVDTLAASQDQTSTQVAALEAALASTDTPTQRLGRVLQMVRAMELLTRARLWLTQNNPGLAADDVLSARTLLSDVAATAPESEATILSPILERLDLALQDLQTAPIVAADDIEVAWQLLLEASSPS
jgi:uncharacterized coiled-coil protein SlyX